jgi:hypothetical protein
MSTDSNVAIFRPYRPWLNKESKSVPTQAQNVIPQWYKDADIFAKMPNGEYYKAPKEVCPFAKEGTVDDYGKIPTWKACPAIMDAFLTGYVFKTPCDLTFFKNNQGIIDVKIESEQYQDFCTQCHSFSTHWVTISIILHGMQTGGCSFQMGIVRCL